MKVLLVNPNYRNVYKYVSSEATMILPPLGLAYIAAVFKKNNIDVKILDLATLNLSNQQAKKIIEKFNPDILGITAATNTIEEAYDLINLLKLDSKIVVGGPHTSVLPERTLKECPKIDIVVRGEGEHVMLEIAQNKPLSKIKGISYKKDNKIYTNPPRPFIENLDELSFPARDLLPLEKYWSPGIRRYPFATLITSRGCPFNCNFCVNYTVHGKKFRIRSVENIMKEIDELVHKYKVKEINILDDNFTLDSKRVEKLCDELIKRNYDLIWKTGNGIRADSINENLIKKMKSAGCYLLAFGIESGNPQILKNINKGETLEQIETAVRLAQKYKILTEGFFMIGNLGENKKTIRDTINFAKKLNLSIAQFQIFIPIPGSKYYKIIKREGKLFAKSWKDYNAFSDPIFEHGSLTKGLMLKMQKQSYKEYYFRPKMIIKKIFEIKSLKQFIAYVKAGLAVFKFGR